jgi:hypothetical protein
VGVGEEVGEGGAVVGSGVPSLRHSLTAHSLSFIRASLPPLPVPVFCGIVGCKASPPPLPVRGRWRCLANGNASSAPARCSHIPTVALLDPSPSPSNFPNARALTSLSIGPPTAGATSLPQRNAATSTNIPVTGLCSPLHSPQADSHKQRVCMSSLVSAAVEHCRPAQRRATVLCCKRRS